jgi:hypothetical protein
MVRDSCDHKSKHQETFILQIPLPFSQSSNKKCSCISRPFEKMNGNGKSTVKYYIFQIKKIP